jgi:hypothetical protein
MRYRGLVENEPPIFLLPGAKDGADTVFLLS